MSTHQCWLPNRFCFRCRVHFPQWRAAKHYKKHPPGQQKPEEMVPALIPRSYFLPLCETRSVGTNTDSPRSEINHEEIAWKTFDKWQSTPCFGCEWDKQYEHDEYIIKGISCSGYGCKASALALVEHYLPFILKENYPDFNSAAAVIVLMCRVLPLVEDYLEVYRVQSSRNL